MNGKGWIRFSGFHDSGKTQRRPKRVGKLGMWKDGMRLEM